MALYLCREFANGLDSYQKFIQHLKRPKFMEVKYDSLDQTIVFKQTPIFEWYMSRIVLKNGTLKKDIVI